MDNTQQQFAIITLLDKFKLIANPMEKDFLTLLSGLRRLEKIKDSWFNKIIADHIPSDLFKDETFMLKAVVCNTRIVTFVDDSLKNITFYQQAVKANVKVFIYISEEFKTYELCLQAVKFGKVSLYQVPEKHRTIQLCLLALRKENVNPNYSGVRQNYKHVKIVENPDHETTVSNLNEALISTTIKEIHHD